MPNCAIGIGVERMEILEHAAVDVQRKRGFGIRKIAAAVRITRIEERGRVARAEHHRACELEIDRRLLTRHEFAHFQRAVENQFDTPQPRMIVHGRDVTRRPRDQQSGIRTIRRSDDELPAIRQRFVAARAMRTRTTFLPRQRGKRITHRFDFGGRHFCGKSEQRSLKLFSPRRRHIDPVHTFPYDRSDSMSSRAGLNVR